jgi:tellurite resistance protein TerC
MRSILILTGAALVERFHWLLYAMGAFLLFTGVKWAFARGEVVRPKDNVVVRAARRLFPITDGFAGGRFFGRVNGRRALTPLFLALLMVETTDILFALDSVPAVFAVTQNAFIILTSNLFAILGLRSLYFVLVAALQRFRHLKRGLACVLIFIGAKMLAARWWALPTGWSLLGVAVILGGSVALSARAPAQEGR